MDIVPRTCLEMAELHISREGLVSEKRRESWYLDSE